MNRRVHLVVLSVITSFLVRCSTTGQNCYPHIYLDTRYEIRGTYGASDGPAGQLTCYHFVSDRDGRIVRIDYRKRGQLSPDPFFGVATILIEHSKDYETRIHLDANGKPAPTDNGVYSVRLTRDERGNTIEWRNLGAGSRLKEAKDSGATIIRWKYDERGNTVEEGYFGADERSTADRNRGVAVVRWKYDERGNTVEERYFGADERLTADRNRGVAVVRWKYDERGNTVEERYLGIDGQLAEDKRRGVAIVRWQFDTAGSKITILLFDSKESLITESWK